MTDQLPEQTTVKPLAEWLTPHQSHELSDWFINLDRSKIRRCGKCQGYEIEHPVRGHGISDDLLEVCTGRMND